jgi:hypothetical protein
VPCAARTTQGIAARKYGFNFMLAAPSGRVSRAR